MGTALALIATKTKLKYSYTDVVELLPQSYREKITANEGRNRAKGHELLLWCITQATHFIAPTAASVLQFIIARTYGYAKEGELISVNHFITGVFAAKTGKSTIAPAVRDKVTARNAIALLEGMGFITKTRITINNSDVVSLITVHPEAILSLAMTEEDAKMLRISRKQKLLETIDDADFDGDFALKIPVPRVGGKPPSRVGGKPPTEYINKEDTKKTGCSHANNVKRVRRTRSIEIDCNTTAEEAIAKATARVTATKESKARRGATGDMPTLSSLIAMWQSAVTSRYGFTLICAITAKQYGMFKRVAKVHSASGHWRELIEWTVANWERLNQEHKEFLAYKKKQGEWSTADERKVFLGSDRPDLFNFVMNYVKILRRFTDYKFKGREIAVASTADVDKLKKELGDARRMASAANKMLTKKITTPVYDREDRREKPRVNIVDPAKDTFFDEVDADLPEWR